MLIYEQNADFSIAQNSDRICQELDVKIVILKEALSIRENDVQNIR